MLFYQKTTEETLKVVDSSSKGLSGKEAKQRLKKYGYNSITIKGEPLWRKIVEPFWNVFMLVLIIAAAIAIFKGEALDAVIIVIIIAVSSVIYYAQSFSTERILRALRKHDKQTIEVLRNEKAVEIDSEELVPGDIIMLYEGQKIPADARLLHAKNVRCDESLLTGESTPVSKQTKPLQNKKETYEQTNMLFQGSFVVSGEVTAVIVATGNDTQFGQLAALAGSDKQVSPVQNKIDKLLTQIVVVIAAISVVAFGLSLLRNMEAAEALRFVLTLAVSAVPEGLPVAITVILVLGMRRMAKRKALVRSMRAIESIGVITTIATDKTGTLTKNQLSVTDLWQPHDRAEESVLAKSALLTINRGKAKLHDPLDDAMHRFASEHHVSQPKDYKLIASLPFDHQFAMSGNVWSTHSGHEVIVKGAPEHVLARSSLTEKQLKNAEETLKTFTSHGFRVIAIAKIKLPGSIQSLEELPKKGFIFEGFLTVADILRSEAKSAIQAAKNAGVSVRMVTGDHFETAYTIGKLLGMVAHREQVFDSREMTKMTDKTLVSRVSHSSIFARVIPENKHRLLSILKKHDITAMTGDGVNDVPALSNAHVGIAMGSGSQIAKEAGDIVLLDNNFKSIITAIKEGRIILSNIRRMLFYLLATSAGEVMTMLGALLIGLPLPVATVQILWINLVTDTSLVIPLGLEPGEKHIMKTPPRKPTAPILDRFLITRIIFIALAMAIIALCIFFIFLQSHSVDYARTITFSSLVVMQWANAFNARSELQSLFTRIKAVNTKFYIGLAVAISLQMFALFGPLQSILHVAPVNASDLLFTGAISAGIIIIIGELHKVHSRRNLKNLGD